MDDEVRELAEALGEGHALPELTARGLVATCTSCGAIMGIRDRHCPSCGAAAGMVTALNGADPHGETQDVPALDEPEDDAAALPGAEQERGNDEAAPDEQEDGDEETGSVASSSSNGFAPQPLARPPEALVPRAQRSLRAGRRRARAWLAERRPEPS